MDPKYCPSCGARLNDAEVREGWCESCGKKLPASITPVEPRSRGAFDFRDEPEVDDETWSRRRRYDTPPPEVIKKRREAAGALLAVVVIQIICGIVGLVALSDKRAGPGSEEVMTILVVMIVGVSIVFSLLAWWALHQPLPPAIIGLVLYGILFLVDLVALVGAGGQIPPLAVMIRCGVIAGLIAGLRSAIAANDMMRYRD